MPQRTHAWEVQAQTRVDWLRAEAREAAVRRGGTLDDAGNLVGGNAGPYAGSFTEIALRLQDAHDYLSAPARLRAWVRGTRVEGTWANIHTAHARLLEVADDEQVISLVPDVQAAAAAYLPAESVWRKKAADWKAGQAGVVSGADRELLSNALRRAYDANAERYTQLRRYRNVLIGAAIVFAVLAAALAAAASSEPGLLPLCFEGEDEKVICPTGIHQEPRGGDVPLATLLGMIGGAAGGLASLTRASRSTVTSYTLRVARMALKVAFGAVTAVIGIIFLRAGFVPGFDALESQYEIIGYAFVFGMSQQFVTRIADQHAERILKGASTEGDGDSGG